MIWLKFNLVLTNGFHRYAQIKMRLWWKYWNRCKWDYRFFFCSSSVHKQFIHFNVSCLIRCQYKWIGIDCFFLLLLIKRIKTKRCSRRQTTNQSNNTLNSFLLRSCTFSSASDWCLHFNRSYNWLIDKAATRFDSIFIFRNDKMIKRSNGLEGLWCFSVYFFSRFRFYLALFLSQKAAIEKNKTEKSSFPMWKLM